MVDYRGPEVFRGLAKRCNIHMFDRIRKIEFKVIDPEKIQLTPAETGRLPELETISILNQLQFTVADTDVDTAKKLVSACRLASIEQNKNQIELNLNPPSLSCCPSQ